MQELSEKIKQRLPLTDRVAFNLNVNFDIQRCLESEQTSLNEKIKTVLTNFELVRIPSTPAQRHISNLNK